MIKIKTLKYFCSNPHLIYPQYLFNKYHKNNPGLPWMTPRSIEFLDRLITDSFAIFEWGSGKSTKWYAKKSKSVCSIEHNKSWYEIVKKELKEEGYSNVEYKFFDAEDESIDQKQAIKKNEIPTYVNAINEFDEESLDLIVIDGCFRDICVSQALDRVKKGGYICIDNSCWAKLDEWGIPDSWNIVHDSDVQVSRTTIWQRPI